MPLRRVHTPRLTPGRIELEPAAGRHARDVLRLGTGEEVEVFDDVGAVGRGTIVELTPAVVVEVPSVDTPEDRANAIEITIAAAVPKGDRADWMVEKLSELGVSRFVPLAAARSVVLPEGKNKRERWGRIATEAAKQSRRRGVMRIEELTRVGEALQAARGHVTLVLSTEAGAESIAKIIREEASPKVTFFIGPEGGWTSEELELFTRAGARAVALTNTILRVETAAVVAASVAAVAFNPPRRT